MPLYPIGAFFLGIIVAKAGGRLLDNAFKAHRQGEEAKVGYYKIGANHKIR